jgi:hypothetical protein
MIDHTFAVPGLVAGGGPFVRAVVDAAFAIPGVHAVGIDWTGATLTVTSSRPIDAAELSAAIDRATSDRRCSPGAAGNLVPATAEAERSPTDVGAAWSAERAAARAARLRRDRAAEWHHLERAHILSQPSARRHVRTHLAMLAAGARRCDRREVAGQLLRLVLAAPGSLTGRYPAGNTGGADVDALTPMPIPADLLPYLAPVRIEAQA